MAGKATKNKADAARAQKNARRRRLIFGVILLAAAAALIVAGVFLFQKEQQEDVSAPDASSYEAVMGSYYSAVLQADGKAMSQLMAPPEYWTYYLKAYDKTETDVINTFAEGCNATLKEWQDTYGPDVQVSYQIKGMSQQGDAGVAEWNSDMEEMLGNNGASISQAVTLEVYVTYKGSVTTGSETVYPTLGKIGESWYIIEEDNDQLKNENP